MSLCPQPLGTPLTQILMLGSTRKMMRMWRSRPESLHRRRSSTTIDVVFLRKCIGPWIPESTHYRRHSIPVNRKSSARLLQRLRGKSCVCTPSSCVCTFRTAQNLETSRPSGRCQTLKRCETGLNCAHTALEGVYAVHARLVQNEWNIYRLLEVTDNSYGDGNGAAFRTR